MMVYYIKTYIQNYHDDILKNKEMTLKNNYTVVVPNSLNRSPEKLEKPAYALMEDRRRNLLFACVIISEESRARSSVIVR